MFENIRIFDFTDEINKKNLKTSVKLKIWI